MEKIIEPVSKHLLIKELTEDKFIRRANYGENDIYIFSHHDSPNLMKEVGRLREVSFRNAGGGTGKSIDVDKFDLAEKPYKQLIVWNQENQEIRGGYRFIECKHAPIDKEGTPILATSRLFNFSNDFKDNYLPHLIELGRSFVVPSAQASKGSRRGMYTLDNLWDGLGALIVDNPDMKYFFGKVTMYKNYNKEARNLILYFMEIYFGNNEHLVKLINPLELKMDKSSLEPLFTKDNYKADYKILSKKVRELGETIPPLINAYMNLSPSMKVFGTSINPFFGNVEETAIMISIKDIYKAKSERHIESYERVGRIS